MTKKKNEVHKMLSPEETSLLQDVMAGLQALLMSNNAGAMENPVEGTGATEVQMGEDMMPKDEANKGDGSDIPVEDPENMDEAQKSNDGPVANDKAEDRTEDGTALTEDNLSGVAKAILALAKKAPQKPVQKSSANDVAAQVIKAISPAIERIGTLEKDLNAVLEAIGVADAMETVEKSQDPIHAVEKSVKSGRPVTAPDAGDIINLIAKSVVAEMVREDEAQELVGPRPKYKTPETEARKALGSAIIGAHIANKGA